MTTATTSGSRRQIGQRLFVQIFGVVAGSAATPPARAQRSLRPAVSASAAQFVPAAEINASGPCGNPASNNG